MLIANPVLINMCPRDGITSFSLIHARRSSAADPSVPYVGVGSTEPSRGFTILASIFLCMINQNGSETARTPNTIITGREDRAADGGRRRRGAKLAILSKLRLERATQRDAFHSAYFTQSYKVCMLPSTPQGFLDTLFRPSHYNLNLLAKIPQEVYFGGLWRAIQNP